MPEQNVKFSIILPTTLSRDSILAALRSIQELTGPSFELVLIIQKENEIPKNAALELSKITNKSVVFTPSACSSIARNEGIRRAAGEYIFFMEDDAELPRNFLSLIGQEIEGKDGLFTAYKDKASGLKNHDISEKIGNKTTQLLTKRQAAANGSFLCTTISKKWALKIGGVDERFGVGEMSIVKAMPDVEFLLALISAKATIKIAPSICAYHPVNHREARADFSRRLYDNASAAFYLRFKYMGPFSALSLLVFYFSGFAYGLIRLNNKSTNYYYTRLLGVAVGSIKLFRSKRKGIKDD